MAGWWKECGKTSPRRNFAPTPRFLCDQKFHAFVFPFHLYSSLGLMWKSARITWCCRSPYGKEATRQAHNSDLTSWNLNESESGNLFFSSSLHNLLFSASSVGTVAVVYNPSFGRTIKKKVCVHKSLSYFHRSRSGADYTEVFPAFLFYSEEHQVKRMLTITRATDDRRARINADERSGRHNWSDVWQSGA